MSLEFCSDLNDFNGIKQHSEEGYGSQCARKRETKNRGALCHGRGNLNHDRIHTLKTHQLQSPTGGGGGQPHQERYDGKYRMVVGSIMVADCADYESYRSGKFIPGIMGTLFPLVDKLVPALSATVVGIAVTVIGLEELPTNLRFHAR